MLTLALTSVGSGLIGFLMGYFARRNGGTELRLGVAAFGLLIGSTLGLSTSPLIAAVVAGIFGILTALVPVAQSKDICKLSEAGRFLLPFSILEPIPKPYSVLCV